MLSLTDIYNAVITDGVLFGKKKKKSPDIFIFWLLPVISRYSLSLEIDMMIVEQKQKQKT